MAEGSTAQNVTPARPAVHRPAGQPFPRAARTAARVAGAAATGMVGTAEATGTAAVTAGMARVPAAGTAEAAGTGGLAGATVAGMTAGTTVGTGTGMVNELASRMANARRSRRRWSPPPRPCHASLLQRDARFSPDSPLPGEEVTKCGTSCRVDLPPRSPRFGLMCTGSLLRVINRNKEYGRWPGDRNHFDVVPMSETVGRCPRR